MCNMVLHNVHYNVHLMYIIVVYYMYFTCTLHVLYMYIIMHIINVLQNVPPIVHKMYIIMYIMQKHNAHVM